MRNACVKNAILFMVLHVSRLQTLRIHVVGTVITTATCAVFLAGVFSGDFSDDNIHLAKFSGL